MPSLTSALRLAVLGLFVPPCVLAANSAPPAPSPPEGPIGFFLFVGSDPTPPALQLVVPTRPLAGGRFWVGEAVRSQLSDLVKHGLRPVYLPPGKTTLGSAPETVDTDGDGLSNDLEAIYHTDPNNPDTDQDFLSDGDEVNTYGTWPLRESSDGDRYDDGQEILGFSPWGLGQLGGDMPGYVLAPGNGALVAAYPKIDFEIVDNIEMQATEQVTVGTKTITTETKSKSTTQRSVDIVERGDETNYVAGDQRAHNEASLVGQQQLSDEQSASIIDDAGRGEPNLYNQEVRTGSGTRVDAGPTTTLAAGEQPSGLSSPGSALGAPTLWINARDFSEDRRAFDFDPIESRLYFLDDDHVSVPLFVSMGLGEGRRLGWGKAALGVFSEVTTVIDALGALGDEIQAQWLPAPDFLSLAAGDPERLLGCYNQFRAEGGHEIYFWLYEISCCGQRLEAERQSRSPLVQSADFGLTGLAGTSCSDRGGQRQCVSVDSSRIQEDLPPRILLVEPASEAAWRQLLEHIKHSSGCARESVVGASHRLTEGPFDLGAELPGLSRDFGSGVVRVVDGGGRHLYTPILDDPDDEGETSRKSSLRTYSLRETIVTQTYSWSVTKEDWQSVTTDSGNFGSVTFSFRVRNLGTDLAQDTTGLRFNLWIGDNPATPEDESFNPVTFPSIQDPAIQVANVGPGDDLVFAATVPLQKYQFRALDEGASLRITVADFSYGQDELFFRSASGRGVMFELDYGVLAPEGSRRAEYLVPVEQVWDERYGILRPPTYTEVLSKVVQVEQSGGVLSSIAGRPIGGGAWWSMFLTEPMDASLFARATARSGERVLLKYQGDADGDAYSDEVEIERGTDPLASESHPSPNVVGGLFEEPDPDRPGWVKGRLKVSNLGDFPASGVEARLWAADSSTEIADALVGGSGLIEPGRALEPAEDVFRYRASGGKTPLLEIRYNDPEGLHILVSTLVLSSLSEDLTPYVTQMVPRGRLTAEAPSAFYYDQSQTVKVGYSNPTNKTIEDAWIAVDWQSLMGDILFHEDRQLDLAPGSSYATFSFKPEEYLAPINIGGQFKALVRVMDHNGALIDSKVAYMVVYPRAADIAGAGAPRMALSESVWSVGSVTLGEERTKTFTVANTGGQDLEAVFSAGDPSLTVEPSIIQGLTPGGTAEVRVRFRPLTAAVGPFVSEIRAATNDPLSTASVVPVSATVTAPGKIVTLYSVEGRPWDRRLFVYGTYPAGTTLTFDHDFVEEPDRFIPLYLFDSRRVVVLGVGSEIRSTGALVDRVPGSQRQVKLVLPEGVGFGAEFILQFGKRYADATESGGVSSGSMRVRTATVASASLDARLSRDTTYDDFSASGIRADLWTISGTGVAKREAPSTLALEVWGGGTSSSWSEKATTARDFKVLGRSIDVFEFRVGGGSIQGAGTQESLKYEILVGTQTVDSRVVTYGMGGPFAITPFVGRLTFDRSGKVVKYEKDGVTIGTFNLSAQATWKVSFGVAFSAGCIGCGGSAVPAVRLELDWTREFGSTEGWRMSLAQQSNVVWDAGEASAVGGEGGLIAVRSADLSSELNAAIVGAPSQDGVSEIPYVVSQVGFKGQFVLTNLVTSETSALGAVNLVAFGMSLMPSAVVVGNSVTVEVEVVNESIMEVPPFVVSTFLGDPSAGGRRVGSVLHGGMAAGAQDTVSMSFSPSDDGSQEVFAVIDPTNAIAETNEGDNSLSRTLLVADLPDLLIDPSGVSMNPAETGVGSVAWVTVAVRNQGGATSGMSVVELWDEDAGGGRTLVGRGEVEVSSGAVVSLSFPWTPASPGRHQVAVAVDGPGLVAEGDETNNTAVREVEVTGLDEAGLLEIDCGDAGQTDRAFAAVRGYGFTNGERRIDWGMAPHQSVRYDFGGSVRYRFENLQADAVYHLDAAFFEADGVGRVMLVWIDGADMNARADLSGGVLKRLSVTVPQGAYLTDGAIEVEFRREGSGDALVSELRLAEVSYRYLDSGDGGITDIPYTAGLGYGYLNGAVSSSWGTTPERSVRYSTTGDVVYQFDGLDPARNYQAKATFFENDGAGRVETLRVDELWSSGPVALNATPKTVAMRVPNASYATDGSVIVRIRRSTGPNTVVSEVWLEEETLPYRALSGGTVTPATGSGSTSFEYSVTYTDEDNLLPASVTVSLDGGAPQVMTAVDAGDTDVRDGKRYRYSTNGLTNGLHAFRFAGSLGGAPLTGDVGSHAGPLVGGYLLPESGAYGLIPGGDGTHPRSVSYAFDGFSEPVFLGFEAYDVDTAAEVEVLLNGVSLGFVETTGNGAWSGARALLLAPSQLRALEVNHLEFRNTLNQTGGTEPWGVRTVSLLPARPEGLVVVDVAADNGDALQLSWTASADDGARLRNVSGYRVYRSAAPSGPFIQIGATGPGETTFVDSGRTVGTELWYEVTATNGLGESAVPLLAAGLPLDNLPPLLAGVSPPNGATGVPVSGSVVFHLTDSGTGVDPLVVAVRINGAYAYPRLTGTQADTTATVPLPVGLTPGQQVVVTVSAADRSSPANALDGATFAFTTAGDTTPPYIVSSSPGDGATGVDPATAISLSVRDDGAGIASNSVVLRVNGIVVQPAASEAAGATELVYQPPTPFTAGQTVTVQVSASDLANPANAGTDSISFGVGSGSGPLITGASPGTNPRALVGSSVPFQVEASDSSADKMDVGWKVDGASVKAGVTFNGANGGEWASSRALTLSAPAAAKTDEEIAVAVASPSVTPGDYLAYDDFATLSGSWTFFNGGGTNPAPTANGVVTLTTSNSNLSSTTDTYAFLNQNAPASSQWGARLRVTAASSGTADVGAGMLVKLNADNWYFVGSMVVSGVRKAGLFYQSVGQTSALFTAAETDPALDVRMVRDGNLLIASYRKVSGGAWIEIGRAPVLSSSWAIGPAAWNPSVTAAASQFDIFRMWNGVTQPATMLIAGMGPKFNDLRVTESSGSGERQVGHLIKDSDNDGFAETLAFHADTLAGGPPYNWKSYKVYYGNALASDVAVALLPGSNASTETVTFGSPVAVTSSSFDWTATPVGSHAVRVVVSDAAASDTHDWTVTVVQNVPATPTRLTAVGGDGKVFLSWLPSDEVNVAGYNVYRAGVKINGAALPLAAYTDSGRTNGAQVCYTVRAVNGGGTESADSTQACATPGDDTIPAAPLRLQAMADNQVVVLTWLPAWQPDVAGYNVFRRVAGGGSFVKLNGALVVPALYSDTTVTNFTAYEYQVTALDQSGHESAPSEIVAATPQPMAPAAPAGLAGVNFNGAVQLTWTASTGPNLSGYNVYRSFVSGLAYQKINGSLMATPAYTDSTGIEGVEYFYVVKAVGTSGVESAASNEVAVTPNAAPFAPGNLSAAPGNRSVDLAWDPNAEPDLAGYNVYRSLASGGPYTRVTPTALAGTGFVDENLAVGQAYYYIVRAVDDRGAESGNSSEASAVPGLAYVLVVHDEGDENYAGGIRAAAGASGRFFDEWDVRTAGTPGASALLAYRIVLWNLGPEFAATLLPSDQAALASYLDHGGRLAVFGQDLIQDLGTSNPFVQTYLHVAGSTQNSCGSTVFGVTGDHVSHGLQLPLSPPFFNGCDLLTPDASATTVFTGAGGQPAAVRTSDGVYPMTTFLAFPFEGVSDTDPDPNNEAMLVRRIIEWLELDPRIFSDQFEGGSIDRWSSIRTAD